ncbi:MAG TPA: hypothetical protein VKA94_17195 [Hyphomicrobiales bacterium]|nr:hypothetical protein [Hyphomicrobiales bacterium]
MEVLVMTAGCGFVMIALRTAVADPIAAMIAMENVRLRGRRMRLIRKN